MHWLKLVILNVKKFLLCSCLLFVLTCAKEDSQYPNTQPSDITNQNSLSVSAGEGGSVSSAGDTFMTKSERYSNINETTSYYKEQEYFTNYLSVEKIESYNYSINTLDYKFFNRDQVFTDMNNDNKVDIFAFSTAFPPFSTYSYETGRYFFLSNYEVSNDYISKPSIINFSGSRMFPNDFNNDGINEVMFYHHNSKMNSYNQQEDVGGGVNF